MWDNLDDAFGDLDAKEYNFFAQALGAYRKALLNEGFTNDESMELVVAYAKFIYDMGIEQFLKPEDDADIDEDEDSAL